MEWAELSEAQLRARVPVFINSFEQFTYLRDSVDWFHAHGFRRITVFDHGSTYPALLDYFGTRRFRSIARLRRTGKNVGPRRAVRRAVIETGHAHPFLFTDPDLGLPAPPHPYMLQRMIALGRKYDVVKVGLALDVYDGDRVDQERPVSDSDTVYSWFSRCFDRRLERNVYAANIDTTFFLYVPRPVPAYDDILTSQPRIPGIRLAGPGFLADHRPWLYDNGMPAEEEAHYKARTSRASTLFHRAERMVSHRRSAAG